MNKKSFWQNLNPAHQCREYGIKTWQCPQFLFVVMGVIIIFAIIITDILARNLVDPEVVALIVLLVTAILFIIGYFIVASFDKMAKVSVAKSEFISIMSHNLRNPLSSIKWQLNVLLSKKVNLTESEVEENLKEINAQNEYMISLVNDLLDINKIEDGGIVLNPSSFSFKEVAEEVVASFSTLSHMMDVSVSLMAQDDLPLVFADKEKIKSAFSHLVDNAIRYTPGKGKVTVTLEKFPGHIKCIVTDEGIGISEADARNIFSKFFRSHGSLKFKTSGMGVGLFIARSIIEMSGGLMGFSSIEGRGSTFWFTLPASNLRR